MTTVGMPELRYTPQPQADALQLAEELSEIADRAQTFTAATGVVIALRKRNELVVRTSDGLAPDVGTRIPFPSGVTGLCITTRKPQTCCSADLASQLESVFRSLDVRSALGAPIERAGEVCGVLVVTSQISSVFTRTHVALLMTLADVAASKLAQYTALWDVPQKDCSTQILDLDAESLLAAPAPEPAKPAASTVSEPVKVSPPAAPVTAARVETVAPAPIAKVVPISAPVRPQPSGLVKEAPDVPARMDPAVLTPAENPIEYGSLIKPKPALAPAVNTGLRELNLTRTTYASYRTQKSKRSSKPLVGGIAAVLILGLAAVLYPRHRAVVPPPVTNAVAENTVTAAPSNPVPVAPPANSVAQPVTTATAIPLPAATTPKPSETAPTVETPKHVPELRPHESAPILLASAAAKPKPEETVEVPNLALTATTAKALSDLPIAPAHAITAPRPAPAVMVPATRLQGKNPLYPPEARRRGESGVVKLMISISAEGRVTDARVLSGNPLFVPASVAAVRDWTYAPAKLDGKPVASSAEISLRFTAPLQ